MKTELYLADKFKDTYSQLEKRLPQSLLLYGEPGMGLDLVARDLSGKNPQIFQPIDKDGEVNFVSGNISIEQIRQLYQLTRSKTVGRQIFLIEQADKMSLPAQNAFLKLLEEPFDSVHFILTTDQKERLLPTILSRVQAYHLPRISTQQSKALIDKYDLSASEKRQISFVASGRPALIMELATNDAMRKQLVDIMSDARAFLSQTPYQSLAVGLKYANTRDKALTFVDAAMTILKHSLYTSPEPRLLERAEQLDLTKLALLRNANPKLQIVQFVLS